MTATVPDQEIIQLARSRHETMRSWRRSIHRYPELSFTEDRTTALVNATLLDQGLRTETEVARTGVIGHIEGEARPVVGLRADMDALPITEANGFDFDSTRPGLMHACGHDAHTAILLATAVRWLEEKRQ